MGCVGSLREDVGRLWENGRGSCRKRLASQLVFPSIKFHFDLHSYLNFHLQLLYVYL